MVTTLQKKKTAKDIQKARQDASNTHADVTTRPPKYDSTRQTLNFLN